MTGWKAMGFLFFPVFGLVLLTVLFVGAVRQSTKWPLHRRVVIALLCIVGGAYLSVGLAFHVLDFWRIRNSGPANIVEIRIGNRVLTSEQDIAAICSVLRETEWFESQHGGWAEELVMALKTGTGHEYEYRIGYYRVHPGAVILHRIGGDRTYLLGEVGFNSRLPDVLSRMGVLLPQ